MSSSTWSRHFANPPRVHRDPRLAPRGRHRIEASQATRRSAHRGAAMVEAAVVFPVLVIFLGLLSYAHAVYDEMLREHREAMAVSLEDATRGCPPPSTAQAASSYATVASPRRGVRADPAVTAALSPVVPETTRVEQGVAVSGGRSKSLSMDATFACNPTPADESTPVWFDWGFEQAR